MECLCSATLWEHISPQGYSLPLRGCSNCLTFLNAILCSAESSIKKNGRLMLIGHYEDSILLNTRISSVQFSRSVRSDSVTPWSAACQASLSITNSWSLLKLMSIESVTPSNHLILCSPHLDYLGSDLLD